MAVDGWMNVGMLRKIIPFRAAKGMYIHTISAGLFRQELSIVLMEQWVSFIATGTLYAKKEKKWHNDGVMRLGGHTSAHR